MRGIGTRVQILLVLVPHSTQLRLAPFQCLLENILLENLVAQFC